MEVEQITAELVVVVDLLLACAIDGGEQRHPSQGFGLGKNRERTESKIFWGREGELPRGGLIHLTLSSGEQGRAWRRAGVARAARAVATGEEDGSFAESPLPFFSYLPTSPFPLFEIKPASFQ